MSKKHNLGKINLIQFYIQFIVACLFGYDAFMIGNKIKIFIAILLLISWYLGFVRHRVVRKRLNRR
tara:strand:+ start:325 stop:522 length:198 start_codon:yes stop_codon:yes gene_type:complete